MLIHPEKLLEGTIAGIVAATLSASLFVPFTFALIASTVVMILEAIEIEYFKIDDNFFIPIVSGILLSLFLSL